jgi:hypothetical protein
MLAHAIKHLRAEIRVDKHFPSPIDENAGGCKKRDVSEQRAGAGWQGARRTVLELPIGLALVSE